MAKVNILDLLNLIDIFSGVREIFNNVTLKMITKQQYLMLQRALKSDYLMCQS